jgi:hypothetical protein
MPGIRRYGIGTVVAAVVLVPFAPGLLSAAAQESPSTPGWATDAGLASANAVTTGLLVSISRMIRGEPAGQALREGFARGALAGATAFAGKRVAAESFPGAGLIGRQLHGAGVSAARSVAEGNAMADELTLFVGPLQLNILRREGSVRPFFSASANDLYWIAYGVAHSRLELDVGESLSSGSTVFRVPDGTLRSRSGVPVAGAALGSVIVLADGGGEEPGLLAHERSHALQFDFLNALVTRPVERWALGFLPGGERVRDHVHLDSLPWVGAVLLGKRAESRGSPWEVEADALAGSHR